MKTSDNSSGSSKILARLSEQFEDFSDSFAASKKAWTRNCPLSADDKFSTSANTLDVGVTAFLVLISSFALFVIARMASRDSLMQAVFPRFGGDTRTV